MNVFYKFRHTKDVILLKKTIKGGAMAFARATMLVLKKLSGGHVFRRSFFTRLLYVLVKVPVG
jgi:hypothetical protein